MKKLRPVDVSAYNNNAIRKPDGRFYMRSEVDEYLRSLEDMIDTTEFAEKYGEEALDEQD